MLFTMQEIQEILKYLNRAPLGFAEQLFAQKFFERLVAFVTPPKSEPNVEEENNGHTNGTDK